MRALIALCFLAVSVHTRVNASAACTDAGRAGLASKADLEARIAVLEAENAALRAAAASK